MVRIEGLENASARYLAMLPLDAELFEQLAGLPELAGPVRKKLVVAVTGGRFPAGKLLQRDDLTASELVELARSPGVGAAEVTMIVEHRNCSSEALAEVALKGMRQRRLHARELLDVLRSINTPCRVMVVMVESEMSASVRELGHALDQLLEGGPGVLETFLVLVGEWEGTLLDLLVAAQELG